MLNGMMKIIEEKGSCNCSKLEWDKLIDAFNKEVGND
jgi:hypothetical protein